MNFKDRAKLKHALSHELNIIDGAVAAFIERPDENKQLKVKEFAVIYNAVSQLGNLACEYAFKHLNLGMCQDKYKTLSGGSLRRPELINIKFAKKDEQVLSEIDDSAKEFIRSAKQVYGDDSHYYLTCSDLIALGYSLGELSYKFDAITW